MMEALHITSLRRGAEGNNRQATNYQNTDEAKANPYPNLPDPLTLKNGKKVTTVDMWWKERRPEIVEDFDREVYGRVPKDVPKVKVLILSMHNNREYIFRIIQAGAHGYVSKGAATEELVRAIESVCEGEPFFSPEVARAALTQFVSGAGKKEPFAQLTQREREVLALIADGQSNKEIANQLGIGVRTIETHRERIMRKLGIHTIAGLTRFAIMSGVISLDEPDDVVRR